MVFVDFTDNWVMKATFTHGIITRRTLALLYCRYMQIEFTFWYRKHINNRTIWILNLITAVFAVFYGLSMWIFNWYRPQVTRKTFCEYFNVVPEAHIKGVYLSTFSAIPLVLVAYARLLYIAKRTKPSLGNTTKPSSSTKCNNELEKKNKRKWKPVKLVFAIFAVCCAGWVPSGSLGIIMTFDPTHPKKASGKNASLTAGLILIPTLSGYINAWIYTMHREVKLRFLQLMGCKKYIQGRNGINNQVFTLALAHHQNTTATGRSNIPRRQARQTANDGGHISTSV